MAKYNLKQLVKISKFDFYETNEYYYTKKNKEPFRNLFRKKENRKYEEGWVHYYSYYGEIFSEEELDKNFIIKDDKCYEKPEIRLFFTGGVTFKKRFESLEEVTKFEEMIVQQAKQDFNYIIEL